MKNNKIEEAFKYYTIKSKEIIDEVNVSNNLKVDEIISLGRQLFVLENKLTALEVANEN
jgi:hypothetical protein